MTAKKAHWFVLGSYTFKQEADDAMHRLMRKNDQIEIAKVVKRKGVYWVDYQDPEMNVADYKRAVAVGKKWLKEK